MLLQMVVFHSFLWLNNIPLHVNNHAFLHSSVAGHLGCFHVLAVVNSAAVNVGVCIFSSPVPPGMCPGVEFLGHMVALFLVF